MEFIPESKKLADYLAESDEVNYSHPFLQEKVDELFTSEQTDLEMAKLPDSKLPVSISLMLLEAPHIRWVTLCHLPAQKQLHEIKYLGNSKVNLDFFLISLKETV